MKDGRTGRLGQESRELVRLLLDDVAGDEPAAEEERDSDGIERLERFGEGCRSRMRVSTALERRDREGRTAVPQLIPRLPDDEAELDVKVGVVHGGLEEGAEDLLGESHVG